MTSRPYLSARGVVGGRTRGQETLLRVRKDGVKRAAKMQAVLRKHRKAGGR